MQQHRDGRPVGPVQVLEHQQERAGPAHLGEQGRHRRQQVEAVEFPAFRPGGRSAGDRRWQQHGQPGPYRFGEPGGHPGQALVLPERLDERLVWRHGLFIGVPDQDLAAVGQGQPGELGRQARFADAGLAG